MGERMDAEGLAAWQRANNVVEITAADRSFAYDAAEQDAIRRARPWEKDPHYFREVRISAVALLKMMTHARRGGQIEVMGLLQGRVDAHTMIVVDVFGLPVQGTETRVNAQAEANEYMITYTESCEPLGRREKVIGWYHSHPGYGCWLSGIDVDTQALNQQFQEPWLAIVVDPVRTVTSGKVEIGAFRTYPKGYKPASSDADRLSTKSSSVANQSIPLSKIDDFGVHSSQYYQLEVSMFRSALDQRLLEQLWAANWMDTIRSAPLLANSAYCAQRTHDLAAKLKQVNRQIAAASLAAAGGSTAFSMLGTTSSVASSSSSPASVATMIGVGGRAIPTMMSSIMNGSGGGGGGGPSSSFSNAGASTSALPSGSNAPPTLTVTEKPPEWSVKLEKAANDARALHDEWRVALGAHHLKRNLFGGGGGGDALNPGAEQENEVPTLAASAAAAGLGPSPHVDLPIHFRVEVAEDALQQQLENEAVDNGGGGGDEDSAREADDAAADTERPSPPNLELSLEEHRQPPRPNAADKEEEEDEPPIVPPPPKSAKEASPLDK